MQNNDPLVILQGIVLILFFLFTVLPLLFSIIAKISPVFSKKREPSPLQTDFACVITAYKDVECAKNLVLSLLRQEYSPFHIYLLADDSDVSAWTIAHPKFTLLKPESALHSKVKAIRYCLERAVRNHSHFVVFDPDNLAHPSFLKEMNGLHAQGFEVVQGKRIAKNLDTKYACLDAFSEYYYNYTQRTVPFDLGSSATIAGSGMSLPIPLYLHFLKLEFDTLGDKIVIAEDKMLQVYVVENGHRIAFAENAIVYDEKVSTAHQVKRQRTRWITSYFQYLVTGLKLFGKALFRFSWNKLMFAYTIVIPPMFIIGLAWIALSVLFAFTSMSLFITLQTCFLAFVINIFVALILGNAPTAVTTSLFYAPLFVFNQVKALFSMKDTKTSFLTTEKTKNVSLDEVMNNPKL